MLELPRSDVGSLRSEPLFIVGTERSGSNLLRVILDSHSEICVPHPPHVLNLLGSLDDQNWSLSDRAAAIDLLLRNHIHPWSFRPDVSQMAETAEPKDLYGLLANLYEQAAARENKPRWGCKSTFMIHHVDRILRRDPSAKIIWLVRDPRDVAASSKRSVFNPYHPILTGRLWARQQALGLELEARLPSATLLRLHYEDLVQKPEDQLRELCRFLRVGFEPSMLQFFLRDEARRGAGMSSSWKNTARPILASNVGKHQTELSVAENAGVEAVCSIELQSLGYVLENPPSTYPDGSWNEVKIGLVDFGMRLRGELRSFLQDANRFRRFRRWATVKWLTAGRRRRPRDGAVTP